MDKLLQNIKSSYVATDYDQVILLTDDISFDDGFYFEIGKYRLSALISKNLLNQAGTLIDKLNNIKSNDRWLIFLRFNFLKSNGNASEALALICSYVDDHPHDIEAVNILLTHASKMLEFSTVSKYSPLRFGHHAVNFPANSNKTIIVIQTYVKADTLRVLFEDLLQCEINGGYKLLVVKDYPKNESLIEKSNAVDNLICSYYSRLSDKFGDVRYVKNSKNSGTSPTCLRGINSALEDQSISNVIFIEDDCRISKYAFLWFDFAFSSLVSESTPFVGGESIFFNNLTQDANERVVDRIKKSQRLVQLENKYIEVDFVPSTCFGLKSKSWAEYFMYRGMPEGPETLNSYLMLNNRKCLMPVVPRLNDLGMFHEDGYSMMTLKGNVKEIKRPYLMSQSSVDAFEYLHEEQNDLYKATCLLEEEFVNILFDIS
jgi:hypothetical protein